MYRFLLQPRWIILHLLWFVSIVAMIGLGLWQLDRLDEKRDRNAEIVERAETKVSGIGELVQPGDPVSIGDEIRFYELTLTGTYLPADQVLLRGQSLEGRPGFHVLTPLDLGDGTAIVVNRGWIPAGEETDGSDSPFDTPTESITVSGILERGYPDPRPSGDVQTTIAHVDLEWFDEQVDADLYPVLLQLESQSPAPVDDMPIPLEPPALDEGPHLSYAVQWFLFTAVVLIGYPILLRRIAHQRASRGDPRAEAERRAARA